MSEEDRVVFEGEQMVDNEQRKDENGDGTQELVSGCGTYCGC